MSAGWTFLKFIVLINFFTDVHTGCLLPKHRGTANEELKEKLKVNPHNDTQSLSGNCVAFGFSEQTYHHLLIQNPVSISVHLEKQKPLGVSYKNGEVHRVIHRV